MIWAASGEAIEFLMSLEKSHTLSRDDISGLERKKFRTTKKEASCLSEGGILLIGKRHSSHCQGRHSEGLNTIPLGRYPIEEFVSLELSWNAIVSILIVRYGIRSHL